MSDHVDPYRLYLHDPSGQPGETVPKLRDLDDYYTAQENLKLCEELQRLFKQSFRTKVLFGRRHYAASPAWRDELTTGTVDAELRPRFVVRVHLFEDRGTETKPEAGRYLGFVSLRPPGSVQIENQQQMNYAFFYIIDAELTHPAHMQRPRYHVLTTTASSARLGVLPFRSAVYSVPGMNSDRGSACVHHAVSQALHLVMGRFGCRPISHIEFDWHLWLAERALLSGEQPEEQNIQHMGQRGAGLQEALSVIETTCHGGGFLMVMEPRENRRIPMVENLPTDPNRLSTEERATAARWLTDALACGLPIIAVVRAGNLLDAASREALNATPGGAERLNGPHAVLLLGMHLLHSREENGLDTSESWDSRVDRAEIPGRVVLHDTLSRGPYAECMLSDFLTAAELAFEGSRDLEETQRYAGVQFLVVGPKNLKMSLPAARHHGEKALMALLMGARHAKKQDNPADEIKAVIDYLDDACVEGKIRFLSSEWSLICRLLNTAEIMSRYAEAKGLTAHGEELKNLAKSYFWVVEARHPRAGRRSSSDHIAYPEELPPAVVFIWDGAESAKEKFLAPGPKTVLRYKSQREENR